MRINVNSPDGNIFHILGEVYKLLGKQYSKKEIDKWLNSVIKGRNYNQIIDKIQEDWCLFENVEPLEFYRSTNYEMERSHV